MGLVQTSQAGLGWGAPQQLWSKATKRQQKTMVVDEITRLEQEYFHVKAISQGSQGAWTQWDVTVNRRITWEEIWRMLQSRLTFLLRATYDTIPCPQNLTQWFGDVLGCPLCGNIKASIQHILSRCKVALTQGSFRWRHDQVLAKLAEVLESCRVAANCIPAAAKHFPAGFVKSGSTLQPPAQKRNIMLAPGKEWQMLADVRKQLVFPRETVITTLWPDIIMWSTAEKRILLIELTIPWEEGMTAAHERKHLKYSVLAAECQEASWRTRVYPVEVGCWGFVGRSTVQLLHDARVAGSNLRKPIKELGEKPEKSSYWLWLQRKHNGWGLKPL
ncbi:hypothetical protein ROHU_028636 [Labeo rohita]|uniref:Reverse transcriptase zinc-binding domain-containing protein n=1 Tax=Labeo rohita TaxID=84645 RepID=A0A498MB47_LABRO|nr:hypothetical protein ROHU_030524 [Labeo rohita]RXN14357.1 hypothetical protein ROHU_028636 [Labeo rohita]